MAPKAIPDGYHTVTPSISFADTAKAIEFYTRAFGAKENGRFPGPGGRIMHADISIGNSRIMMADEWPDSGCMSAETLGGKSPVGFYVYVDNPDALFDQAVKAGAKAVMPVAEMFWGDRAGTLSDPFGYQWTIASHTRDLSPEQMKQGAEQFFASMKKG
jgi:uncharacterized glyoxalase superfamily protein PhnB